MKKEIAEVEPLTFADASAEFAAQQEPEDSPELVQAQIRVPRHTAFAIKHLVEQRGKAVVVRDRATGEVTAL